EVSMMPEGLLVGLSDDDVRDLIVYLAAKAQVPLPENAAPESSAEPQAKVEAQPKVEAER
ncbi:MAG TPA: hypothetical protein VK116_11815, partial [Planctomycetota bacterium]|nr:hypothetical protein [Planctomycetota bacterium]